jgi:predicted adenylyl cyclase CyaB
MPTNLEIKARLDNISQAIEIAEALPSEFSIELKQMDTYFSISEGRLKLREINNTYAELIYYIRSEESNERVSNFEIYPISKPDKLKSILSAAIGVKAIVQKRRLAYLYQDTRIHLDEVEGLGSFIEFEVPINSNIDNASCVVQFLIGKFHLNKDIFIKGSYVDLILEKANILGN